MSGGVEGVAGLGTVETQHEDVAPLLADEDSVLSGSSVMGGSLLGSAEADMVAPRR